MNLEKLDTEKRNAATENLDTMSVMDILRVMNNEDKHVLEAVRQNLPQIEQAVELCYSALNNA